MEDGGQAFADKIAPPWVPFPDVPRWIETQFGIQPPAEWMLELFTAMRTGTGGITYRIANLDATEVKLKLGLHRQSFRDVPWLSIPMHQHQSLRIASWEAPHFDLKTFTIAGPPARNGTHSRHVVEVKWDNVRFWLETRVIAYKRRHTLTSLKQTGSNAAEAEQPAPPQPMRGAGGAPAKHGWDSFWVEVAHWTALNTLDGEDRNRLRKYMIEWSAKNMRDPAPEASTVRKKLSVLFRRADAPN